ncbi:nuclear transport factor 2 family protein [Rhodohalobacter halophilus]|uniref:nuclear transport factor 2 family protein n=1 Tax=Rhodohalobacter halophilus TaxID=1812810 RepID=UPI00083F5925|nr:nuclear transport factor 2 family protein [Rhodohalobacter halophilus]
MKKLIWLLLILISTTPIMAQSLDESMGESDEVRETIMKLFDGMEAADGNVLRSVLDEGATFHTVRSSESGTELNETDMKNFIESVEESEPGSLIEEILYISVNVDGDLATAWMDYHFYQGVEFSHCGVNSMNLIRKNGEWKIFSIVDTRRTEGCLE